jgi:predicted lipoprotein with Yx(FWY)xxD motif
MVIRTLLGITAAGVLAAACSSSGGGSTTSQAGGSGMTVNVRSTDQGDVLTDANGHTLYSSDEEASGKLLCTTQACLAFWTPLVVADGQPSGPSSVTAKLTTVARPDGKPQVALNGAPLYTFEEDHSAGQTKGDDFTDKFGSQSFTWHVATPSGISASQAPTPSSSSYDSGNPYGY